MKKKRKKLPNIDDSVVYEALQLKALDGKLNSTLVFFERKVRSWYSETFSTSLSESYKVPWAFLLSSYYSYHISNMSYNEAYERTLSDHLPKFKKEIDKENEEFAASLIEEQKETIKKKAMKDEDYRKKIEAAGEVIEGLPEKVEKIIKTAEKIKQVKMTFEEKDEELLEDETDE